MGFDRAFYMIDHGLIALAMVAVLAVVGEIGFRMGSRNRDASDSFRALMSGIGAASFGLLGLLLGFTLSMAIARWDTRSQVLIDESKAIARLSLQAGLFEPAVRDELRASLNEYLDARVMLGGSRDDLDAWYAALKKSEMLQTRIWSTVEKVGESETWRPVYSLIPAAINLFDVHESRLASIQNYLPASLLLMLLGVALVSIYFLAWSFGAVGQRGRVAVLLLGLLIATILFLIMDVNRPQRGTFIIGVETLERTRSIISGTATP